MHSLTSNLAVIPISKKISEAEDSSILFLANRQISSVPNEVAAATEKLCDIRYVDISRNSLSELDDTLCKLMSLVGLSCEKNSIRNVSPLVSNLVHLQFLNLSCNLLCEFPESLSKIPRLKILILKSNRIASVSPEIGSLSQLQKLDLSHNEITTLPDELCSIKSLRSLNVRQNALRTLPEDIGSLQLQELDVSVNRLRSIPLSLTRMKLCLRVLAVHDNPLDSPPLHIAVRGKTHVLNYLFKQEATERTKMGLIHQNSSVSFNFGSTPSFGVSLKNSSRDSGYQTSDSISETRSLSEKVARSSWNNVCSVTDAKAVRSSSFNNSSTQNDLNGQSGSSRKNSRNEPIFSSTERHSRKPFDKSNSVDDPQTHSYSNPSDLRSNDSTFCNSVSDGPSETLCIPRRISLPSPSSGCKAVNRSSHDSIESTSSTLTDASADNSPSREEAEQQEILNCFEDVEELSRTASNQISLADYDDLEDDEDAVYASIRRRSNALSFSESEKVSNEPTPSSESTPNGVSLDTKERKCPIVYDCDALMMSSNALNDSLTNQNNCPTSLQLDGVETSSCSLNFHPDCMSPVDESSLSDSSSNHNKLASNSSALNAKNQHIDLNGSIKSLRFNGIGRTAVQPPKPAPKPSPATISGAALLNRRYQSPMRPPPNKGVPVLPPKFTKGRSTSCDPKRLVNNTSGFQNDSNCVVKRIVPADQEPPSFDRWPSNPNTRVRNSLKSENSTSNGARATSSADCAPPCSQIPTSSSSPATLSPRTAVIAIEDDCVSNCSDYNEWTTSPQSYSPSARVSDSDRSVSLSSDVTLNSTVLTKFISPDAGKITARRQALNFQDERRALKSIKQVITLELV